MCGIYGIITSETSDYSEEFLTKSLTNLALLSESRGKDSSGICAFNQKYSIINVLKGPIRVKKLLTQSEVQAVISDSFTKGDNVKYIFGHARLVTNGAQLNDGNNQPVVKDGIIGVHNGIIVNVDELWENHSSLKREYEIDTEVLLAIIRENLKNGYNLTTSVSLAIKEVFGTVAVALAFNDLEKFVLSTNNGSLYVLHNADILFFASELYFLKKFEERFNLRKEIGEYKLYQIKPKTGVVVDFNNFNIEQFDYSAVEKLAENFTEHRQIDVRLINPEQKQLSAVIDLNYIHLTKEAEREKKLLEYPIVKIKALKRCTKCLLPETFPFIEYDEKGVCNYCRNYKKKNLSSSLDDLHKLIEPYRKSNGKPDVLIPYSGGRDSTFVLHTVKTQLDMNPIAFTYDWGMVTDLARRNIARICGKLGIENIIVAADIHWKRENIRKNISAWLKKPTLGMIPLFMAGDKFFFYYAYKVKKQLGIDLEIWGVNELENTNFKTGFAGLKPQFDKKRIYSLSLANKVKLFGFVAKNVLSSPGYMNQSILDSLGSFASRYITPKVNYLHLFDYFKWDEKNVENTIIDNYEWEKAVDTKSTWRIGDGTASFYNYIYTLTVGFSENDTFRSNQIREGMITREEALERIYEENKPRYNSLKWYLEIIGLDYENTIKRINSIPKHYKLR